MTVDEIKAFIQGGEWVSIAPELRPSQNKAADGSIQPFYLTRTFHYAPGDQFACTILNSADANGKVPLAKIVIKGHNVWQGEHPVVPGAQKVDYVADEAYEITPLHPGFADALNRAPSPGLEPWAVGTAQDVKGKAFPLFGLSEGEIYVDYDLIYVAHGMLFNGSKTWMAAPSTSPKTGPPTCRCRWCGFSANF